jgi:hypothetical protein
VPVLPGHPGQHQRGAPRPVAIASPGSQGRGDHPGIVDVGFVVFGRKPVAELAASLKELEGVRSVSSTDSNASDA